MKILWYLLLLIHFLLLFWAVGGYIEMFTSNVPWKPYTNPDFPFWVLLLHWGVVLFASVIFIYGYLTRWSKTPQVMTFAYGLMAGVCVIETFGFMTSTTKYLAMGAEFLAYFLILLLLYKSHYFNRK